jgi:CRISPR/Cas system-associated exonuclease Cas4 (RecB family)
MLEGLKLSRSKIDLYINCPRCFYLDIKKGLKRPSMPGFSLNSAVDALLKKEFDILRTEKKVHKLMEQFGINAIPFSHPQLEQWRYNFHGVRYNHPSGLILYGAVDDIWINEKEELHIVDYKSTSTSEEITLEGPYKEGYKRQIEIYQYLLQNLGFNVSNIGYFVYANARKDLSSFDEKLIFDLQIISYQGDNSWVEGTINKIIKTLKDEEIPLPNEKCEYCKFAHNYNNSLSIQPSLF